MPMRQLKKKLGQRISALQNAQASHKRGKRVSGGQPLVLPGIHDSSFQHPIVVHEEEHADKTDNEETDSSLSWSRWSEVEFPELGEKENSALIIPQFPASNRRLPDTVSTSGASSDVNGKVDRFLSHVSNLVPPDGASEREAQELHSIVNMANETFRAGCETFDSQSYTLDNDLGVQVYEKTVTEAEPVIRIEESRHEIATKDRPKQVPRTANQKAYYQQQNVRNRLEINEETIPAGEDSNDESPRTFVRTGTVFPELPQERLRFGHGRMGIGHGRLGIQQRIDVFEPKDMAQHHLEAEDMARPQWMLSADLRDIPVKNVQAPTVRSVPSVAKHHSVQQSNSRSVEPNVANSDSNDRPPLERPISNSSQDEDQPTRVKMNCESKEIQCEIASEGQCTDEDQPPQVSKNFPEVPCGIASKVRRTDEDKPTQVNKNCQSNKVHRQIAGKSQCTAFAPQKRQRERKQRLRDYEPEGNEMDKSNSRSFDEWVASETEDIDRLLAVLDPIEKREAPQQSNWTHISEESQKKVKRDHDFRQRPSTSSDKKFSERLNGEAFAFLSGEKEDGIRNPFHDTAPLNRVDKGGSILHSKLQHTSRRQYHGVADDTSDIATSPVETTSEHSSHEQTCRPLSFNPSRKDSDEAGKCIGLPFRLYSDPKQTLPSQLTESSTTFTVAILPQASDEHLQVSDSDAHNNPAAIPLKPVRLLPEQSKQRQSPSKLIEPQRVSILLPLAGRSRKIDVDRPLAAMDPLTGSLPLPQSKQGISQNEVKSRIQSPHHHTSIRKTHVSDNRESTRDREFCPQLSVSSEGDFNEALKREAFALFVEDDCVENPFKSAGGYQKSQNDSCRPSGSTSTEFSAEHDSYVKDARKNAWIKPPSSEPKKKSEDVLTSPSKPSIRALVPKRQLKDMVSHRLQQRPLTTPADASKLNPCSVHQATLPDSPSDNSSQNSTGSSAFSEFDANGFGQSSGSAALEIRNVNDGDRLAYTKAQGVEYVGRHSSCERKGPLRNHKTDIVSYSVIATTAEGSRRKADPDGAVETRRSTCNVSVGSPKSLRIKKKHGGSEFRADSPRSPDLSEFDSYDFDGCNPFDENAHADLQRDDSNTKLDEREKQFTTSRDSSCTKFDAHAAQNLFVQPRRVLNTGKESNKVDNATELDIANDHHSRKRNPFGLREETVLPVKPQHASGGGKLDNIENQIKGFRDSPGSITFSELVFSAPNRFREPVRYREKESNKVVVKPTPNVCVNRPAGVNHFHECSHGEQRRDREVEEANVDEKQFAVEQSSEMLEKADANLFRRVGIRKMESNQIKGVTETEGSPSEHVGEEVFPTNPPREVCHGKSNDKFTVSQALFKSEKIQDNPRGPAFLEFDATDARNPFRGIAGPKDESNHVLEKSQTNDSTNHNHRHLRTSEQSYPILGHTPKEPIVVLGTHSFGLRHGIGQQHIDEYQRATQQPVGEDTSCGERNKARKFLPTMQQSNITMKPRGTTMEQANGVGHRGRSSSFVLESEEIDRLLAVLDPMTKSSTCLTTLYKTTSGEANGGAVNSVVQNQSENSIPTTPSIMASAGIKQHDDSRQSSAELSNDDRKPEVLEERQTKVEDTRSTETSRQANCTPTTETTDSRRSLAKSLEDRAYKSDSIRNYWQVYSNIRSRGSFDSISHANETLEGTIRCASAQPVSCSPLSSEHPSGGDRHMDSTPRMSNIAVSKLVPPPPPPASQRRRRQAQTRSPSRKPARSPTRRSPARSQSTKQNNKFSQKQNGPHRQKWPSGTEPIPTLKLRGINFNRHNSQNMSFYPTETTKARHGPGPPVGSVLGKSSVEVQGQSKPHTSGSEAITIKKQKEDWPTSLRRARLVSKEVGAGASNTEVRARETKDSSAYKSQNAFTYSTEAAKATHRIYHCSDPSAAASCLLEHQSATSATAIAIEIEKQDENKSTSIRENRLVSEELGVGSAGLETATILRGKSNVDNSRNVANYSTDIEEVDSRICHGLVDPLVPSAYVVSCPFEPRSSTCASNAATEIIAFEKQIEDKNTSVRGACLISKELVAVTETTPMQREKSNWKSDSSRDMTKYSTGTSKAVHRICHDLVDQPVLSSFGVLPSSASGPLDRLSSACGSNETTEIIAIEKQIEDKSSFVRGTCLVSKEFVAKSADTESTPMQREKNNGNFDNARSKYLTETAKAIHSIRHGPDPPVQSSFGIPLLSASSSLEPHCSNGGFITKTEVITIERQNEKKRISVQGARRVSKGGVESADTVTSPIPAGETNGNFDSSRKMPNDLTETVKAARRLCDDPPTAFSIPPGESGRLEHHSSNGGSIATSEVIKIEKQNEDESVSVRGVSEEVCVRSMDTGTTPMPRGVNSSKDHNSRNTNYLTEIEKATFCSPPASALDPSLEHHGATERSSGTTEAVAIQKQNENRNTNKSEKLMEQPVTHTRSPNKHSHRSNGSEAANDQGNSWIRHTLQEPMNGSKPPADEIISSNKGPYVQRRVWGTQQASKNVHQGRWGKDTHLNNTAGDPQQRQAFQQHSSLNNKSNLPIEDSGFPSQHDGSLSPGTPPEFQNFSNKQGIAGGHRQAFQQKQVNDKSHLPSKTSYLRTPKPRKAWHTQQESWNLGSRNNLPMRKTSSPTTEDMANHTAGDQPQAFKQQSYLNERLNLRTSGGRRQVFQLQSQVNERTHLPSKTRKTSSPIKDMKANHAAGDQQQAFKQQSCHNERRNLPSEDVQASRIGNPIDSLVRRSSSPTKNMKANHTTVDQPQFYQEQSHPDELSRMRRSPTRKATYVCSCPQASKAKGVQFDAMEQGNSDSRKESGYLTKSAGSSHGVFDTPATTSVTVENKYPFVVQPEPEEYSTVHSTGAGEDSMHDSQARFEFKTYPPYDASFQSTDASSKDTHENSNAGQTWQQRHLDIRVDRTGAAEYTRQSSAVGFEHEPYQPYQKHKSSFQSANSPGKGTQVNGNTEESWQQSQLDELPRTRSASKECHGQPEPEEHSTVQRTGGEEDRRQDSQARFAFKTYQPHDASFQSRESHMNEKSNTGQNWQQRHLDKLPRATSASPNKERLVMSGSRHTGAAGSEYGPYQPYNSSFQSTSSPSKGAEENENTGESLKQSELDELLRARSAPKECLVLSGPRVDQTGAAEGTGRGDEARSEFEAYQPNSSTFQSTDNTHVNSNTSESWQQARYLDELPSYGVEVIEAKTTSQRKDLSRYHTLRPDSDCVTNSPHSIHQSIDPTVTKPTGLKSKTEQAVQNSTDDRACKDDTIQTKPFRSVIQTNQPYNASFDSADSTSAINEEDAAFPTASSHDHMQTSHSFDSNNAVNDLIEVLSVVSTDVNYNLEPPQITSLNATTAMQARGHLPILPPRTTKAADILYAGTRLQRESFDNISFVTEPDYIDGGEEVFTRESAFRRARASPSFYTRDLPSPLRETLIHAMSPLLSGDTDDEDSATCETVQTSGKGQPENHQEGRSYICAGFDFSTILGFCGS